MTTELYKSCKGCYWFEEGVCHPLIPRDEKPGCYDTPEDIKKRKTKG